MRRTTDGSDRGTARPTIAEGWSTAPGKRSGGRRRHIPALLLLIPLVMGLFAAPQTTSFVHGDELSDAKAKQAKLKKEIAEQKAQIAQLNGLQSALSSEIAATRAELRGITVDLNKVRKRIDKMAAQIAEVQGKYEDLVAELDAMTHELNRLTIIEGAKRVELSKRRAKLAERVRTAYDTDRTSPLETFISGGTFTDLLAEMSYYIDVAEQDKALAEQITRDKETLAALHQNVEETRKRTNVLAQETAAQKRELDRQLLELKEARAELKKLEKRTKKALAAQKRTYAELKRNKANAARIIRKAAADQKALARRIDKLIDAQVRKGNIPSKYNGTLRWPMKGTVSGDYGCSSYPYYAPGHGCAHYHNGIDLVGAPNAAVRAAGKGVVAVCGWNWADGSDPAWIVVIAHSGNLRTWYAHMQPGCPAKVGEGVSAGELIGHQGNTGNSTGAHLHWMVEFNGEFTNPRLFL